MNRRAFGGSDSGKQRERNEDTFLMDEELGLYLVCDGLGGHAAGEVASAKTCQVAHRVIKENYKVLEAYTQRPSFYNRARAVTIVELAVETACREVYWMGQAEPEKRGMASTIVLLALVGENAILAHVGDSRIYVFRQNQVHQLTEDHSLVNDMIRKGQMTREQAAASGKNPAMTRAIGIQEYVQVDTLHLEIMPGDTFLLCTDGLSDYFTGVEFGEICRQYPGPEITDRLIEFANSRGGKDNITSVVVQIDPEASGKGVEVARKVEALRTIPLFRHLSYQEVVKVMTIVRVLGFDVGDMIIREGESGDELFICLSGKVQVSKGGHKLADLGRGAFFGEMGLLDKAPRSADVVAIEPARMMVIRRPDFTRLLKAEPQLAVKLLWAFCHVLNDRLRNTSEELSFAKANLSPGEDLVLPMDDADWIDDNAGPTEENVGFDAEDEENEEEA